MNFILILWNRKVDWIIFLLIDKNIDLIILNSV